MSVLLTISDSGRVLTIKHSTGRVIAEILVHGHLKKVLENIDNNNPIAKGIANIFRGELYQLAGYEWLNTDYEIIEEKLS
jgi:glutamine cyclotransferase